MGEDKGRLWAAKGTSFCTGTTRVYLGPTRHAGWPWVAKAQRAAHAQICHYGTNQAKQPGSKRVVARYGKSCRYAFVRAKRTFASPELGAIPM